MDWEVYGGLGLAMVFAVTLLWLLTATFVSSFREMWSNRDHRREVLREKLGLSEYEEIPDYLDVSEVWPWLFGWLIVGAFFALLFLTAE